MARRRATVYVCASLAKRSKTFSFRANFLRYKNNLVFSRRQEKNTGRDNVSLLSDKDGTKRDHSSLKRRTFMLWNKDGHRGS